MKDFVEWLLKNIVDSPDQVKVAETLNNDLIVFDVSVAQEDMGKIIGKSGRIIKSIRNLLRIKGIKVGKRVSLNLLETQIPPES